MGPATLSMTKGSQSSLKWTFLRNLNILLIKDRKEEWGEKIYKQEWGGGEIYIKTTEKYSLLMFLRSYNDVEIQVESITWCVPFTKSVLLSLRMSDSILGCMKHSSTHHMEPFHSHPDPILFCLTKVMRDRWATCNFSPPYYTMPSLHGHLFLISVTPLLMFQLAWFYS